MNFKKLLSALLFSFLFCAHLLAAPVFPSGFSQVKIANISNATAMDFAPDGRIFVAQRDGTINIIKNGVLLTTPFVKLTTDQNGERGVSGITFDPNFNTNHYVYIYYTATTPTIHNRLSRFTANGDVAVAGSELALLDAETVTQIYHNGGGLAFGKDGKLYLAMGEDNKPSNSQSLTTYKGKLLRMNSDGTAPSDNPYYSSSNPITRLIWDLGLRNPYTMDIHPTSGRIFVNNVGADSYEEVHDGTSPNKNFGWPVVEGYGSDPAYTNPIFAYPHESTTQQYGCAITGGVFFNPVATNYPSQYIGKYFYMEFCNGWISYFTPGTSSASARTNFATGLTTQNLALQLGNDGNLYYLNRKDSYAGVYKIIYNNNNPPAISQQPSSLTVPAGQPASFSVSATGALPLSYQWKKNGVNISGATSATYNISSTTSSHAGQYSVQVSNSYGSVLSNNATLTVTTANSRPVATILTPASNTYYRAGQVINFSGNATDNEDGTLPASSFTWWVEFHHNNNHNHPGPTIPPGIKSGSFTIPNTGETSPNVFYRLRLRVTDSNGLVDTPYVDLLPLKSWITLQSNPSGLQITYDGQPKTSPFSTQAVRGMLIPINAVTPQALNGTNYAYHHWQPAGTNPRTIRVGEGDSTYLAVYNQTTATGCTATGTISREFWTQIAGTSVSSIPVSTRPTSTGQLSIFEAPQNFADNYGQRIRGYICPPVSGNYTFWIASDDNSELWLSTNDNPAYKAKIASVSSYTASREWTKYPSQKSATINLTAGVRYYIEALHKEGSRGDNLAVGWQLPNGSYERPIPGSRLSPFTTTTGAVPVVSITSPTNGTTFSNPSNITINANASTSSGSIVKVEFYSGTNKIGEDLSAPYSFTWMNVSTGNYALKAITTNNTGQTGTSSTVNITVAACSTPIITASGPTTMCSGTVTLKTTYIAGNGYQWKKNGVDIAGATSYIYTASSGGDYQVKVIQGSCISWSAPTKVSIGNGLKAVITAGGPTTFCTGGSVKLYANTCSGYTYQWKKDGTNITGATGTTYTATTTGSYQLKVTLNGTSAWSALMNVQVNVCRENEMVENTDESAEEETESSTQPLAIQAEPEIPFQMKVFPNPTNGLFTIVLNMPSEVNEKITMRIVNMLGQEVYKKEMEGKADYLRETVELDNTLQTGIYTLQVVVGNRTENTSVVLAR